jgi:hypothetical protein
MTSLAYYVGLALLATAVPSVGFQLAARMLARSWGAGS